MWTKEQYKTYKAEACRRSKEWFKGPWWFQESDPVAKFTGWVAAYTFILVVVSALQFSTLYNTDKTTRAALVAANRAWVGPLTINLPSIEKDKGLDITIPYINTGREPAFDLFADASSRLVDDSEWNSGIAADKIAANSRACLCIDSIPKGTRVAYPNGVYNIGFKTDDTRQKTKITVTDELVSGAKILVVQGCFIYRSIQMIHHSSFCYFYQAKLTNLPPLNICTVDAD